MRNQFALTFLSLVASVGIVGCTTTTSDSTFEDTLASIQEEIPGRDRASVRVCEELFSMSEPMSTAEDVLAFVTWGLQEIESSSDPRGMRNALLSALVGSGDAVILGDPTTYQSAAIEVATVCTDIVSGEYGK